MCGSVNWAAANDIKWQNALINVWIIWRLWHAIFVLPKKLKVLKLQKYIEIEAAAYVCVCVCIWLANNIAEQRLVAYFDSSCQYCI